MLFLKIEQIIYLATGFLLTVTAAFALVSAAISVWGDAMSLGAPEETLVSIDRLLFVLMLVEVLHTVRVSIREGTLTAEPFLIVGLIASIRRVLAITLGASHATQPGHWTASRSCFSFGALRLISSPSMGLMALSMAIPMARAMPG